MSLQEFVNKYNGVPNVGNTPENTGQCVGLVELWIRGLGFNQVWGDAKDLLNNADPKSFDIILNSPDNFPLPGDILVWGDTFGNGHGHTGIVTTADVNMVHVFEQNYTPGHAPEILQHNYNGVKGWLHPKLENALTHDEGSFYKGLDLSNKESMKVAVDTWARVQSGDLVDRSTFQQQLEATNSCQTQLKTALEQDEQHQIKITQLQDKLKELQSKYDEESAKNIALNEANAKISSENQDNGEKAYVAEKAKNKQDQIIEDLASQLEVKAVKDKDLIEVVAGAVVRFLDEYDNLKDKAKSFVVSPSDNSTTTTTANTTQTTQVLEPKKRNWFTRLFLK